MEKKVVQGSMLAAVVASLCCIIPLLFAGAGAAAIAVAGKFAAVRPYMLAVTALFFLFGFYFAYRPVKVSCEPGSACATPASRRRARLGLWLATAFAVVLTTIPYWSPAMIRGTAQKSNPTTLQAVGGPVEKATLRISGMVCESCVALIENTLRAQAGVRSARVLFSQSAAEVEFAPSRISLSQIRKLIEKAGYQVLGAIPASTKEG